MHWLRIDRYYSSEDTFEGDNERKSSCDHGIDSTRNVVLWLTGVSLKWNMLANFNRTYLCSAQTLVLIGARRPSPISSKIISALTVTSSYVGVFDVRIQHSYIGNDQRVTKAEWLRLALFEQHQVIYPALPSVSVIVQMKAHLNRVMLHTTVIPHWSTMLPPCRPPVSLRLVVTLSVESHLDSRNKSLDLHALSVLAP